MTQTTKYHGRGVRAQGPQLGDRIQPTKYHTQCATSCGRIIPSDGEEWGRNFLLARFFFTFHINWNVPAGIYHAGIFLLKSICLSRILSYPLTPSHFSNCPSLRWDMIFLPLWCERVYILLKQSERIQFL